MINSFIRFCIGFSILSCMGSCNNGEVYHRFSAIPNNEWNKNQEICFSLELDSLLISFDSNYTITLEILHNITYQYKNLFLLLDYTVQDSITQQDTIVCVLADGNSKWKGSGNGATRQLSVPYKTNIKIDTALHNKLCIRHAMQDLKLKGIEKIGVKVY